VARDAFAAPKQRLGGARAKLRSLVGRGKSFFKHAPYARVVERDPEGINELHKVRFTRQLPGVMTRDAIEAFEHLRSALDQTGYVAAALAGAPNPKRAYFPIADTSDALERDVIGRGRCKDLPPDILALFRSFKPYKDGNPPIWAANRIANSSKHCGLSAAMHCDHFKALRPGYISGNARIPVPTWDHEKNEVVFGIVGPGGDFKYDFEFSFYVTFREIPELVGVPALPLLDAAIHEIASVIAATELEVKRIGLV
jgi:hypothetical protein